MDKHASAFHRGHGQATVGAVAVDRNGQPFAATSTGGTCCKLPGRVGDSPLIGCACYADQEAGGVSCTGYGEAMMKIVMAKTATDLLRHSQDGNKIPGVLSSQSTTRPQAQTQSAMAAARASVDILARRTHATGGLILLDRDGNPGWAFNTPRMSYGYVQGDGSIVTAV